MSPRWYHPLTRPSRLALRIYLIGLVQFSIVAAVMEIDHQAREATRLRLNEEACPAPGPPPRGSLDGDGDPPRGASPDGPGGQRPPRRGPPPPPPPPPFKLAIAVILVVVGVSSWFTARSLTRPLAALSGAARAFGNGDLAARANMKRTDEIGAVASTFDDMANRIADLLLAERELMANVSHELRTPLARIRVALDLASEADPSAAVASFAEIAQDLAELERIVDDILASARLARHVSASGPALPVRAERVEPAALIGRSVERFAAKHPERPFHAEVARSLPAVTGDLVLLRRMVDNLLDNADKYSDRPDASVTLTAREDGPTAIVIDICDEGIGISPEDQKRLFEPFFRADRSRARATGGIGLGLLLARRVAEAHGGTLTIESALGRGTRARIRLPTCEAHWGTG